MDSIVGVILTPLKRVSHPKGDIFHALKKSDVGFSDFGEAYFSTIHRGEIKGWKKHQRMILNLVVPMGEIEFTLYDDRPGSKTFENKISLKLSQENYQRLTVPPNVWMAFRGISAETNLLLNIASIEHDPSEGLTKTLEEWPYDFNKFGPKGV